MKSLNLHLLHMQRPSRKQASLHFTCSSTDAYFSAGWRWHTSPINIYLTIGVRQGEDVSEGSPQANSSVALEKWPHLRSQSLVSSVKKYADAGLATSTSPAHLSNNFIFLIAPNVSVEWGLFWPVISKTKWLLTSCWNPEVVLVAEQITTRRVDLTSTPIAPASVDSSARTFLVIENVWIIQLKIFTPPWTKSLTSPCNFSQYRQWVSAPKYLNRTETFANLHICVLYPDGALLKRINFQISGSALEERTWQK